ncbi:MAG: high frequency lysogenization protein HflD [Acidiferrobacterales bacterium]
MHDRDRIIALAGVFQSALLVQHMARYDRLDEPSFSQSINSILLTDTDSTEAVFGGLSGVRLGLEEMRDKMLAQGDKPDFELARYVLSLVQLAGKVARIPEMLQDMATEIEIIASHRQGSNVAVDTIDELAQLYTRTISHITPRIVVSGEQGYLTNPRIAARVRAALLSGIRAGFLWLQLGGRRWHLIFSRKKMGVAASMLLAELADAGGQGTTTA